MRVLNIVRYLPIKGFPLENDITLKIYADLRDNYGVNSHFILPLAHIPKWATYLKKSLKSRYRIINQDNYVDPKYKSPINFFQAYFPFVFFKLPEKWALSNLRFQWYFYHKKLIKTFERYQPTIIHAHTIWDAFYAFQLEKRYAIPYVVTLRGSYSAAYDHRLAKTILKSAKGISTPSYQLYKQLENEYPIQLIPHGLEEKWYVSSSKKFDNQCLRLVTVSRLLEMKNIQVVLESLAQLKKQGRTCIFDIVGEGPFGENLKELVVQLDLNNEVRFHGFLDSIKIIKVFEKSNVFIMLSSRETFGRAYFEAAAQGLMVIGVRDTGAHGYLTDNEGLFIEPTVGATIKALKSIDGPMFEKKTQVAMKKVMGMKNSISIKRYYDLLKNYLS